MKKFLFISAILLATTISAASQNLAVIKVVFDGTTASVSMPSTMTDVDYTVNGANVEITSGTSTAEYAYELSGSSDDGSLTLTGNYKLTLRLNGLNLTSQNRPAIDIECGKRIAVELIDGTVNTLSDAEGGFHKATLYFTGHPEFSGSGQLNVTGKTKHAISAKEYLEIKKGTGSINILSAAGDGIHCGKGKVANENNYFKMSGGTVNISNIGGDGIDSDDFGVVNISDGSLSINISGDDNTGIKADSIMTISGGHININVSGKGSDALSSAYSTTISGGDIHLLITGDGSKGIVSKNSSSTVLNGGECTVSGGTIEILATGGLLTTDTNEKKCRGLNADKTFTQTGGEITIYAYGSDPSGYKSDVESKLEGGQMTVYKAPWSHNPYDYQYDMSSWVTVKENDAMISDYSEYAVGAFSGEQCVGVAMFSEPTYGELRIRSNDSGSQPIAFKLFDYTSGKEYALTPERDVTFKSLDMYGSPSTPFLLSYTQTTRIAGDVNEDGYVNISDVVAVINHIAGIEQWQYADVDENDAVNISDVVMIINIIAGL